MQFFWKNAITVSVLCLMSIGGRAWAVEPQAPTVAAAEQALMEAAYNGELERARQLIEDGIDVDATTADKQTALMWAAFNGHTDVAAYLLDREAAVDAKDVNARTALMYASSGPFADTVGLLLDKGAEVDIQGSVEGFTALMMAAAEGQLDVVRLLLIHGADPSLKDEDGDTARSFAAQNGHNAVVDLLDNPPAAKTE